MTTPSLLLPLRIPELGPALGKLVTGTRRVTTPSLEDERRHLVTKLIEAAGEARRLAARDERAAAVALPGAVWLGLVLGSYVDAPRWLDVLWSRLFP